MMDKVVGDKGGSGGGRSGNSGGLGLIRGAGEAGIVRGEIFYIHHRTSTEEHNGHTHNHIQGLPLPLNYLCTS